MPQVTQVPNKLQMLGTMFSAPETNVIEHFYLGNFYGAILRFDSLLRGAEIKTQGLLHLSLQFVYTVIDFISSSVFQFSFGWLSAKFLSKRERLSDADLST